MNLSLAEIKHGVLSPDQMKTLDKMILDQVSTLKMIKDCLTKKWYYDKGDRNFKSMAKSIQFQTTKFTDTLRSFGTQRLRKDTDKVAVPAAKRHKNLCEDEIEDGDVTPPSFLQLDDECDLFYYDLCAAAVAITASATITAATSDTALIAANTSAAATIATTTSRKRKIQEIIKVIDFTDNELVIEIRDVCSFAVSTVEQQIQYAFRY
jgi:hypothetical protein